MKSFLKNFLVAIPFAIGVVLTIICVGNAIEAPNNGEKGVLAFISGVIGIPLLFASIVSFINNPNN